MTLSIPLSVVGDTTAFQSALVSHCAALEAHAAGPASVPAPVSIPLLDALVMRVPRGDPLPDAFQIAPYEILDDSPPPPSLEERKAALTAELNAAAASIQNAILSPGRAKLLDIDVTESISVPNRVRSPDQIAAIAAFTAFRSRCVEIQRNAAVAAIEIEDLTERTIGAWKVPSL